MRHAFDSAAGADAASALAETIGAAETAQKSLRLNHCCPVSSFAAD